MSPDLTHCQILVVGAGSSGCVVAARSAESDIPTLLVESGPASVATDGVGPTGLLSPENDSGNFWPPLTECRETTSGSQPEAGHDYWMGRGLGGGSAVNGMLLMSGDRADYDRWAGEGACPSWDAAAMAPWLAKATSVLKPEIVSRSSNPTSPAATVTELFDEAFGELGLTPAGTSLDGDRVGLLDPALAVDDGLRRTVADAYLASGHPSLSVLTDSTVESLIVENRSVTGVVLTDGATIRSPTVVLAAGAIGSARLLHETGHVPRAGRWIRNHCAAALDVPWSPSTVSGVEPAQVHRVARWSSDPAGSEPDLTAILMGPFGGGGHVTGSVIVMLSAPRSFGHLDLSADPPLVLSNRLVHPGDLAILRRGTRQAFRACQHIRRFSGGSGRAVEPTDKASALHRLSDQDLDDWLIGNPGPIYHAVGSCRMGDVAAGAAVTEASPGRAGTVPGLQGLVVADASIFPDLVAGGLQLPVMAVAERIAAETILGDR